MVKERFQGLGAIGMLLVGIGCLTVVIGSGVVTLVLYQTAGPSDDEVVAAVTKSIKRDLPYSLVNTLVAVPGEPAAGPFHMAEVRILQRGRVQGEGTRRYWPVKVYARGSCNVILAGRQAFGGVVQYHLQQDPYGKWGASPAPGF